MPMSHEKFKNVQENLAQMCRAEERRTDANCGYVYMLVEADPKTKQIRLRSASDLPVSILVNVLEMSLLDIRTKGGKSDEQIEIPPQETAQ